MQLSELEAISAPHQSIYEALYSKLTPNLVGDVDAATAANFLKTSNVDMTRLSQIWELADYRKVGALDKRGFYIAFKLIAAAQQGHAISSSVINMVDLAPPKFPSPQPGGGSSPLPQFSRQASLGQAPPPLQQASPQYLHRTGSVVAGSHHYSRSPSIASTSGADWEIELAEQQKYDAIFNSLNPINGKVSGEQCRTVLLNSQLPQAILARIWELADIDRDGQLDRYEMRIAMHLVYKCLQNEHLPDRLPISMVHPLKRAALAQQQEPAIPPMGRKISGAGSVGISPVHRMPFTISSRTQSIASLNNANGDTSSEYRSILCLPSEGHKDWPLDVEQQRDCFLRLDTDSDGLVTGIDIRPMLLTSQLPQQTLAHIWQLVDLPKSGKLNLEQFTLAMELVNECSNHGVRLPESLPPYLIPPSLRRKTSLTPSLSNGVTPESASQQAQNPRLKELNDEIESLLDTRRKAEQDLFQLEADTTVKNSEIKNLEIELLTLTATVKQLHHQKGEANKRLQELDDRITKLEANCTEQSGRLTSEEERLSGVKGEITQSTENSNKDEETLQELNTDARQVQEQQDSMTRQLEEGTGKMEKLVDELTKMERHTDADGNEITRIEQLTKELGEALEQVGGGREEGSKMNGTSAISDEEILRFTFHRITMNDVTSPISSAQTPKAKGFINFQDAADPFKDDPFAGSDDAFGIDPFTSGKTTTSAPHTFDDADPFANRPNGVNGGSKSGDSGFVDDQSGEQASDSSEKQRIVRDDDQLFVLMVVKEEQNGNLLEVELSPEYEYGGEKQLRFIFETSKDVRRGPDCLISETGEKGDHGGPIIRLSGETAQITKGWLINSIVQQLQLRKNVPSEGQYEQMRRVITFQAKKRGETLTPDRLEAELHKLFQDCSKRVHEFRQRNKLPALQ